MRSFNQSDIFMNNINKGNVLQKTILDIVSGKANAKILNEKLSSDLEKVNKIYKETVLSKAVLSAKKMELLLVQLPMDSNLPRLIPFFKFKKNGVPHVLINVTAYVSESADPDTKEVSYSISNMRALYTLLISAYIYLKLIDQNTILPADAIKYSASTWSRLFCKILRSAGMMQDMDRRNAFTYFTMKFFIMYYLEMNEKVAESIAVGYLSSHAKNPLILDMESSIFSLGLDPYSSFVNFTSTMFNSQVTGIKGLRVKNVEDSINTTFFISKFIDNYYEQALMSLCAYPFLLMVIIDGYAKGGICNDRYLEDVIVDYQKETLKLLTSLYKEL